MGKTLAVLGIGLFSLTTPSPSLAQVPVTLQLRGGDRVTGTLIDVSTVGFTLRAAGRDRRFAPDEVAVLEFVPGTAPVDVRTRLERGAHVVVLRSGDTIDGRLVRARGAIPLRLTIETAGGVRELTSQDIAQVFLAPHVSPVHATGSDALSRAPGASAYDESGDRAVVQVEAGEPWTDTGLTVARGERVLIHGSGTIQLSATATSGPEGRPDATSERSLYPVAGAPVGVLIARVGNGTPFAIDEGSRAVNMPNPGRLMLGINDDNARDNSGTFTVTISRLRPGQGAPR